MLKLRLRLLDDTDMGGVCRQAPGRSGMKRITRVGVWLAVLLLTACATAKTVRAPDADLGKLKSFYVVRMPDDERGIEKLIATRLVTLGFKSTSGDAPTPPAPVDAIVTYNDRWMWDITMYMIKLDVQIHDGNSGAVIARAQAMRPSLQRKSPEGMVQEVLAEIFK